jgi:hypothetical protein
MTVMSILHDIDWYTRKRININLTIANCLNSSIIMRITRYNNNYANTCYLYTAHEYSLLMQRGNSRG